LKHGTQFLATMAFPTLFPDGKGDPTNSGTTIGISSNELEALSQKLCHPLRFGEQLNDQPVILSIYSTS